MSRTIHAIAIGCAALLAIGEASALQLTNRDPAAINLVVTENGASQEMVVKSAEMLDGFCLKGCTIKTPDGEEYEFDGTEVVSIEEGLMFLDEPADYGADADLPADVDIPAEGEDQPAQ
ncbi:MAG: hypothetical protein ACFCUR_19105 [Rhodomicrobiaceae bacterium]